MCCVVICLLLVHVCVVCVCVCVCVYCSTCSLCVCVVLCKVLQDRDRLVRRTQLKRTSYKVLGKPSNVPGGVTSGNEDSVLPPPPEPNAHLRDYDEEIFDDSDFYHQVRGRGQGRGGGGADL